MNRGEIYEKAKEKGAPNWLARAKKTTIALCNKMDD
jgi:hypothetical protein